MTYQKSKERARQVYCGDVDGYAIVYMKNRRLTYGCRFYATAKRALRDTKRLVASTKNKQPLDQTHPVVIPATTRPEGAIHYSEVARLRATLKLARRHA